MHILIYIVLVSAPLAVTDFGKGGIGRLPALGFNSWNAFHCDINEAKFLSAAQRLIDLGLKVRVASPIKLARLTNLKFLGCRV
jgi:alpha-galactosidase